MPHHSGTDRRSTGIKQGNPPHLFFFFLSLWFEVFDAIGHHLTRVMSHFYTLWFDSLFTAAGGKRCETG